MKRKRKQASQRWNVSRNHLLLAPPPLKVSCMAIATATYPAPHSAMTPTEFIFHTEGRVTILKYKHGHLLKIFCWFPFDVRYNVTLYHDLRAVSDLLHAHVSIIYLLPFLIHLTSVTGGLLRTVRLAQGVLLQLYPNLAHSNRSLCEQPLLTQVSASSLLVPGQYMSTCSYCAVLKGCVVFIIWMHFNLANLFLPICIMSLPSLSQLQKRKKTLQNE